MAETQHIIHGDTVCPIWGEEVLPDEDGNCSLCGHGWDDNITLAGIDQ